MAFSPDGKLRIAETAEFAAGDDRAPLDLAKALLCNAPPEVTDHFGQSV